MVINNFEYNFHAIVTHTGTDKFREGPRGFPPGYVPGYNSCILGEYRRDGGIRGTCFILSLSFPCTQ